MPPNEKDLPTGGDEKIIPKTITAKKVETYAEDMAQVIGDNREGLIKKIIHQEEENEVEKMNLSPQSRKNKFYIILGTLLILATMAIIAVSALKKETDTVLVEKQVTPIIFNDKSVFIEVAGLTKDNIIQAVYKTIDESTSEEGEVEGIYLTENKNIIGLKRFIELTNNTFVLPEAGEEVLISDNFMMGSVNKDFFILIKIRSLTDVFNNLRNWENKMFSDLYGFFGINLSSSTEYLLTKNFEDGIIENKNARILYEEENVENKNISMMYVFANNTSLVITQSPLTAREVILRLASNQIKK